MLRLCQATLELPQEPGGQRVYRHILIPTDGSELAHKAVTQGLALAKILGAKVTALTVEASFNVYDVPSSRDLQMSGAFAEHFEPINISRRRRV